MILHVPGDLAAAVQLYNDVLAEVAARLKQDDDEPDGRARVPDAKRRIMAGTTKHVVSPMESLPLQAEPEGDKAKAPGVDEPDSEGEDDGDGEEEEDEEPDGQDAPSEAEGDKKKDGGEAK